MNGVGAPPGTGRKTCAKCGGNVDELALAADLLDWGCSVGQAAAVLERVSVADMPRDAIDKFIWTLRLAREAQGLGGES